MGREIESDLATIILDTSNAKIKYLTNYIMIVAKNEIYKRKWKQNIPTLINIKVKLKKLINIEIYLGTITNKREKSIGKMVPII